MKTEERTSEKEGEQVIMMRNEEHDFLKRIDMIKENL